MAETGEGGFAREGRGVRSALRQRNAEAEFAAEAALKMARFTAVEREEIADLLQVLSAKAKDVVTV